MATWREFELAMPEMAASGHKLLYQFGPGLGYLATVRQDGGPRVHPFCPIIDGGQLWAFVLTASPKGRDLLRDDRYALHAFPKPDTDDEFYVTGTASVVDDPATRESVQAATTANVGEPEETLFALDIERAMYAKYETRPQWPPAYTIWRA
jgi:hypothetical protein